MSSNPRPLLRVRRRDALPASPPYSEYLTHEEGGIVPWIHCVGVPLQSGRVEVMGRPVTYSIVDGPDGRFTVVAVSAAGAVHRREALPSLAAAEACIEDLRAAMSGCGSALVRYEPEPPDPGARPTHEAAGASSGDRPDEENDATR